MPLYDVECPQGHQFEIRVTNRDAVPEERCPECGAGELQLVMSYKLGSYSIQGNNSASVTPKRFRGGRPA